MKPQANGKNKSPTKHIPQSRLYWEIKAEQTLNKIFDQSRVIDDSAASKPFTDVEVINFAPNDEKIPKESNIQSKSNVAVNAKTWLIVTASSLTIILLIVVLQTTRKQQSFEQERNLQLLTLLSQPPTEKHVDGTNSIESNRTVIATPPAPPTEEWIQELAKLPPSVNPSQELLKAPLNGTLKTSPAQNSALASSLKTPDFNRSPMPQLVGIIQGSGSSGSAIFQWEGSSASARSGDAIGTSGWRLQTTNGDNAIIERGGKRQRLSLNGNS